MKRCKLTQILEISPAFIFFLCAYYFFDPADTFVPFLVGITVHEAAHLLVLPLLGAKVHRLRLSGCGAVIVTDSLCNWKEIIAAAVGPAANFTLFLLTAKSAPIAAFVNLCLFVYNMLPFYPLDGGRILRALLQILLPTRTALWTERILSAFCCGILLFSACWLTCIQHAGLWPVITVSLLLIRIAGNVLPERRLYNAY